VLGPSAEGAQKSLLKATGGAAAVVDFVGAASSFAFGFGALRKGGKLIGVGLLGGATPVVPAMVSMKAVSIIGSYVGSLGEMQDLMALARTGVLPALPLTQQPLERVSGALADLRAGRVRGRVILKAGAQA
jgi:D-arabinose 1-dehydrogenase-like Zn-dependent alcohol dehydrogenase